METAIFIEDMVNARLDEQEMKKRCKTKTCFTLVDTPKNEYYSVKRPYSPELATALRKKHGSKLAEIINERFLKTA